MLPFTWAERPISSYLPRAGELLGGCVGAGGGGRGAATMGAPRPAAAGSCDSPGWQGVWSPFSFQLTGWPSFMVSMPLWFPDRYRGPVGASTLAFDVSVKGTCVLPRVESGADTSNLSGSERELREGRTRLLTSWASFCDLPATTSSMTRLSSCRS